VTRTDYTPPLAVGDDYTILRKAGWLPSPKLNINIIAID
jgi:hypothetical protein